MKINRITKIENDSKRYDIQTKNGNYFANKILVHNSLIKVWYSEKYKRWMISTNGTIDAYKAEIQNDASPYETFGDLFLYALGISLEERGY